MIIRGSGCRPVVGASGPDGSIMLFAIFFCLLIIKPAGKINACIAFSANFYPNAFPVYFASKYLPPASRTLESKPFSVGWLVKWVYKIKWGNQGTGGLRHKRRTWENDPKVFRLLVKSQERILALRHSRDRIIIKRIVFLNTNFNQYISLQINKFINSLNNKCAENIHVAFSSRTT